MISLCSRLMTGCILAGHQPFIEDGSDAVGRDRVFALNMERGVEDKPDPEPPVSALRAAAMRRGLNSAKS